MRRRLFTFYVLFLLLFCFPLKIMGEEEEGPPFRFEPFPPYTGNLKGFYPRGRAKEEAAMLYTAATFPNPFSEPERCMFSTRKTHSWFCDPEKLLPPQEQAELELALLKVRDERAHSCADGKLHHFQLAVAVMPSLLVTETQSVQEAADAMASQLLRRWAIGNKPCHDGLLLMFVKNHLVVSLVGRENVAPAYISPLFVSFLKARLNLTYLASGSVGATLITGVELIGSQLPQAPTGLSWVAYLIIALVICYILSVAIVYQVLSYTLGKRFDAGD